MGVGAEGRGFAVDVVAKKGFGWCRGTHGRYVCTEGIILFFLHESGRGVRRTVMGWIKGGQGRSQRWSGPGRWVRVTVPSRGNMGWVLCRTEVGGVRSGVGRIGLRNVLRHESKLWADEEKRQQTYESDVAAGHAGWVKRFTQSGS